jgi:hypothetical protein
MVDILFPSYIAALILNVDLSAMVQGSVATFFRAVSASLPIWARSASSDSNRHS